MDCSKYLIVIILSFAAQKKKLMSKSCFFLFLNSLSKLIKKNSAVFKVFYPHLLTVVLLDWNPFFNILINSYCNAWDFYKWIKEWWLINNQFLGRIHFTDNCFTDRYFTNDHFANMVISLTGSFHRQIILQTVISPTILCFIKMAYI